MGYTHGGYCHMPLTPGNTRVGTAAWECPLRHPDADCVPITGAASPCDNTYGLCGRTPADADAVTAAVEREPWRSSRDIAREL
jgi:hypothetical protein